VVPAPIALGLTLCDQVIVEEGTRKVSLIGTFSRIRLRTFPSEPSPFCVFGTLTDGRGDGILEVAIARQDTNEEIYAAQRDIHFPDRFAEVHVLFRIGGCRFASSGGYVVTLLVDGELVAQRRFRVSRREEAS
jgi:hypothetical protein